MTSNQQASIHFGGAVRSELEAHILKQDAEIERLRQELQDAADMFHECATQCAHCDYGRGATGEASEGAPCEECAPIREAERRARAAIGAQP